MTIDKPVHLRPAPAGVHEVTAEEADKPRVVIVWLNPTDMGEFDDIVVLLREKGYVVLNDADEAAMDLCSLCDYLNELASATHLCLPSTWWTNVTAHQIVTIAGWMGLTFIDERGDVVETAGRKGRKR